MDLDPRDKKRFREEKKRLKQLGNQRARRSFKALLRDDPEEAAHATRPDHGRYATHQLNGRDRDATRWRQETSSRPTLSKEEDADETDWPSSPAVSSPLAIDPPSILQDDDDLATSPDRNPP